jgi:Retrotransposon gag protein
MPSNFHHLQDDELEYELRIRGVDFQTTSTQSEKLRFLRNSVRVDEKESDFPGEGELLTDKETEITTINKKTTEIEEILKAKGTRAENFMYFEGRLEHLLRRVKRIVGSLQDLEERKQVEQNFQKIMAMQARFFKKVVRSPIAQHKTTNQPLQSDLGSRNLKEMLDQLEHLKPQSTVNLGNSDHGRETQTDQFGCRDEGGKTSQKTPEGVLQFQDSWKTNAQDIVEVGTIGNMGETQQFATERLFPMGATPQFKGYGFGQQQFSMETPQTTSYTGTVPKLNMAKTVELSVPKEDVYQAIVKNILEKNPRILDKLSTIEKEVGQINKEANGVLAELNKKSQETEPPGLRWNVDRLQREHRSLNESKVNLESHREKLEDTLRNLISQVVGEQTQRKHRNAEDETCSNTRRSRPRDRQSSSSERTTSASSSSSAETSRRNSRRHRRERSNSRALPIARWGIKFSGDDELSVGDFFRQIKIWKKSENVSSTKLLNKAHQLLKGSAWQWYLSAADRFSTWKEFEKGLKEAFTPEDYDYILLQECQKRQQNRNETFEIYLARMNQMFDGLSYKMSEKSKLSIIKQNLKSSHKVGIAMLDIRSIEDLRKYCRRLDSLDPSLYVKQCTNNAAKQIAPKQIFELEKSPEEPKNTGNKKKSAKKKKSGKASSQEEEPAVCGLEGQKNSGQNKGKFYNQKGFNNYKGKPGYSNTSNSSQEAPAWLNQFAQMLCGPSQSPPIASNAALNVSAQTFKPQIQSPETLRVKPMNQNSQMICWNCDGHNHHQRYCTAPRRVFCFKCGKKDVYSNECPTCSGNGSQRLE